MEMRWLLKTGEQVCDECDGPLRGAKLRRGKNWFCSEECRARFDAEREPVEEGKKGGKQK
jgi:hypothetical protein